MRFSLINRLAFLSASMVALALAVGLACPQPVVAAPGPGMGGGMHGPGMHGPGMQGKGMRGGGRGKQCACGLKQGQRPGGRHLYGHSWTDTLSAEQKMQLDQLHVNFAKTKAPLKARIKALKLDLALLSIAPQPDKAVIDTKIAALIELKGQVLGAEYGYVAAQRQVLTPEQQVSFDMDAVRMAMHDKGGKGHRGGH